MNRRRAFVLLTLLLALAASAVTVSTLAVTSGGGDAPHDGAIVVTVTLSRQGGGVGPTFHLVPQAVQEVRVVSRAGPRYSDATDGSGRARFSVPAGEYDVDAPFCPDGPQRVTVRPGATTTARVDCLAP